ncbi:MAG: LysM peptidoglycan-binding domain-containing protein, partial [Ignavibacteriaceae bacterium]
LKDWNNLSSNRILSGQKLKISIESNRNSFASSEEKNKKPSFTQRIFKYKVHRGESLGKIANKFGVRINQLRKWNDLTSNTIVIGKILKIYNQESVSMGDANTKTPGILSNYVIKKGETIGQIAEQFHVSASSIRKWNDIKSNKILAGQKLKIYSDNEPVEKKSKTVISKKSSKRNLYVVKKGDSLDAIANRFDVKIDDIKQWNKLVSNKIVVGQKLVLN